MTTYLLAIDNGSQSTKVSVVDEDGRIHAHAQQRLRPYVNGPGGQVVHPDDDLWASITATCRQALARFAPGPSAITAVGLCTIRFCRALLNADGELAEPVLSWMDARVSRPHTDDPRVRWVTTSSGYITHRLTGQRVDAAANYQGLWPIDQETASWSSDPAAFTATGMAPDLLFDLIPPGGELGRVTAAAASATGIAIGTPVYATANDKAVEALGCGLRAEGDVLLSLGTYIAAMTPGTKALSDSPSYWVNFASVPGEYLYESGGIRRGMWTVSWFRDLVGGGGDAQAAAALDAELNAAAASVPPGSEGLLTILDWLAPGDAPHRRGALLGFDGRQDRGHLYRSILEGIAVTMATHERAMEAALGRASTGLIVSGGGSRSDLFMQILADVFEVPTRRTTQPDAAGTGAAICAAVGAGVHSSFDTAVQAMVRVGDEFTPDPANAQVYRAVRHLHTTASAELDAVFRRLAGAEGVTAPG